MQEDFEEEIDASEEQELFEHFHLVVDKGQSMLRIDKFLMNRMENASRTKIQAAADAGSILVNEKPVKSSYKVKPLDVISIVLPTPPKDTEIVPEDIPLNIIYEDDDVLLVNKNPGMVVHPGYNNVSGTLVNALAWHLKGNEFMEEKNIRPGLVHRIDKNTSGILVIAKNEIAMTHLAKQFFDHSIERTYQALVWGDLAEDQGTITGYIGRSARDRKIFQLYDDPEKGKWSVTHYRVIERLGYVSLIECKLETGRTHQIRVHLRSIGHPIFSDSTYGGAQIVKGTSFTRYKQFVENCFTLMPRQGLHAKSLGFVHPASKKTILFNSDLPEDFQQVIDKWRHYNQYKPFEEPDDTKLDKDSKKAMNAKN
ncbi:MAG: RluA family pseudouridine synthase [Bacteroidia bacterium]|nr:RluA family pseudouridine synthase [Bacteroidia bacterium]MCF8427438.1 RluA family pseudouridine synthase [Bacteroidia bacterium]